MRKCIHEGTLQAWLDGELNAKETTRVAAHVSRCLRCAEAARANQAENLIVAESLALEFAAAIPTDRLRERVNAAVAALLHSSVPAVSRSGWRATLESFASFRSLAYAGLVATVLLAGFFGFLYLKKEKPRAAASIQLEAKALQPAISVDPPKQGPIATPPVLRNGRRGRSSRDSRRNRTYEPDAMSLAWQEGQYEYAIAKLNEAIKIQPPLRPALQVEYEFNMAVINSTIATTRGVARRNPNNPQAAQVMLTAYQSKVDLLNEIANARGPEQ